MTITHQPGAIVVGGYVNALGVVRALASHGVRVAVVPTRAFDVAQYSRDVVESLPLFDFHERPDCLLELLEREARRFEGWAVYATNDHALEVLSRNHEKLERSYRLTCAPWETVRPLLQKDETYRIAADLGIDVARVYGAADAGAEARDDLRFPVVVKPVEGHVFSERFGCKLFVATTPEELRSRCATVAEAGIRAQILDWIPGRDDAIYCFSTYLDARGEPLAGMPIRKLRQSPPFIGVARAAETTPDRPDVREATIELLRRVGYHGMADAQFKLDPRDGRMRLLEVNARPVLYNGLTRRAGVDLAHVAWIERVLGARPVAAPNGWRGVWLNLHADLLYSLLFSRVERLGVRGFLAPYLRPRTHAVWSARDPRPFLVQWSRSGRDAVKTVVQPSLRASIRSRVAPITPGSFDALIGPARPAR